jgi:hypothetical protein
MVAEVVTDYMSLPVCESHLFAPLSGIAPEFQNSIALLNSACISQGCLQVTVWLTDNTQCSQPNVTMLP